MNNYILLYLGLGLSGSLLEEATALGEIKFCQSFQYLLKI